MYPKTDRFTLLSKLETALKTCCFNIPFRKIFKSRHARNNYLIRNKCTIKDKFIKLYGLPRSGTNYIKFLLQINFQNTTVLMNILGWKHGFVHDKIYWDTRDWYGEAKNLDCLLGKKVIYLFKGRKILKDVSRKKINLIKKQYKNQSLYYFFIIKNVYSWIVSYANYTNKKVGSLKEREILQLIKIWNLKNNNYLDFVIRNPQNALIIKYEDLLRKSDFNKTLNLIKKRFKLSKKITYIIIYSIN